MEETSENKDAIYEELPSWIKLLKEAIALDSIKREKISLN